MIDNSGTIKFAIIEEEIKSIKLNKQFPELNTTTMTNGKVIKTPNCVKIKECINYIINNNLWV